MAAILLTQPEAEPISVSDAKAYLRVETDDDDVLIASLIAAARSHVEALGRCVLLTQSWRLVLDGWPPDGRIRPKLGPLSAVAAARVYDEAGAAHPIGQENFVLDAAQGVIALRGCALPQPGRTAAGIEIDIVAGFGDAGSDVPPALMQALRMLIAHWYDNRGMIAIGASIAVMPPSVNALIASHRVLSL
ncbi:Phage gp6-like head-tail connector protein OS=Afipia felis OX=1035 GN=NCTC12722_02678 PE=4 SV=1 [Afipia felis]